MAQVALHKIDPVSGEVTRKWIDLSNAIWGKPTAIWPSSITGNTKVDYEKFGVGRSLRVLESQFEVDEINGLKAAIPYQGQSSLVEATLEMYSGNLLDLAAAANGTTIASTKVVSAYFSNIATATGGSADAVRLKAYANNAIIVIKNPQTFAISVFPNDNTGYIDTGAIGAAYSLAAGSTVSFYSKSDGATSKRWYVLPWS